MAPVECNNYLGAAEPAESEHFHHVLLLILFLEHFLVLSSFHTLAAFFALGALAAGTLLTGLLILFRCVAWVEKTNSAERKAFDG